MVKFKVRTMLNFLKNIVKGPTQLAIAPAAKSIALPPPQPTEENMGIDSVSVTIPPKQSGDGDVIEMSKKKRSQKKTQDKKPDNSSNQNVNEKELTMSQHDHHRKKYLCFDPINIPKAHTAYEFNTCCCGDPIEEKIQLFYDFAVAKRALFPQLIKRVRLLKSPNDGCQLVDISWLLNLDGIVLPQSATDLLKEIFEKYLELLEGL